MVAVVKPVVVLFSGGVDSLAALVWARECYEPENVLAVYCHVGQRYADKEIMAVEEICGMLRQGYVIEKRLFLGDLELPPEQNAIIPYRNTLFILLGALYLPEDKQGTLILQNIVIGESSTWDRRVDFNDAMQYLLDFADPRRVRIKVPHQSKTKSQIVQYLKDKVPEEAILRTVGCYSEGEGNCGACNSCFRSYVALVNAGIPFPERRFKKGPLDWEEGIRGYVNRMHTGQYEQVRVDETFSALAKVGVLDRYLGKTYAIDLDGVIADTMPGKFNPTMSSEEVTEVYKAALPNEEFIDKVNKLYDKGNVIIIHTARYPEDEDFTKAWLEKYGVKYHRLVLGKPRADFYVDDKNLSVGDFKGEMT